MPYKKKTYFQKNYLSLITLTLLAIVLLQRCEPGKPSEGVTIIRDTTWIIKDCTINSKPQLIQTIPVDVSHDTIINNYLPDTNYDRLLAQYQEVVNKFLSTNLYSDSVRIDTIGYVKVTDTVSQNMLLKRGYRINVKYPIITETIIKPAPKVNQLYVGGGLEGNKTNLVNQINAGLLFKNKKDQIFGLNAGLTADGQPNVGISSFWKITLKK
jgi:hypothetical protein